MWLIGSWNLALCHLSCTLWIWWLRGDLLFSLKTHQAHSLLFGYWSSLHILMRFWIPQLSVLSAEVDSLAKLVMVGVAESGSAVEARLEVAGCGLLLELVELPEDGTVVWASEEVTEATPEVPITDSDVACVEAAGRLSRFVASMVPRVLPRTEPIAPCPPQLTKTIVCLFVSAFHS